MRRGGRLVILLGLVIAAAAALFLLVFLPQLTGPAPGTNPLVEPTAELTQQVVVARVDIPSGTPLTDTEFLTLREIRESEYNANPGQYFTDINELQSKKTTRNISAQQPILANDVTEVGLSLQIPTAQPGQPRPKAFPFQVNALTGVADQITPGDFVDVIASFSINQTLLRPGVNEQGQAVQREQEFESQSTKTLVQNVQVLQVIRPAPPAEGTATPESTPEGQSQTAPNGQPVNQGEQGQGQVNQEGSTLQAGNLILILAVTDQQAEVIKYSVERGAGVTLVLRGSGDTAIETTLGTTLDILISQFGLPLPRPPVPPVITNAQLTPVATSAPAPTAAPTATP